MTEPTITVRNLGGAGGASFRMWDNVSGADWKFKATNTGGFKIRDNVSGLDVFVIEQNTASNLIYLKSGGRIGIGTPTPDYSALVDMSSTNKGFLPPRMTQAQILGIASPANGLVVFCTTDEKFYAYISSTNAWKKILFDSGTLSQPFTCGDSSVTKNHVAGDVAPVTKTATYGTVTNIPGEPQKCWITSNLGSDHQAVTINDNSEASAGWYWQFNLKQGYTHNGTTRTPNTTWITSINENLDWQATQDPCAIELSNGWRIPTYSEWFNVDAIGFWTGWNGPWNSDLKLHASGGLFPTNGSLFDRGTNGYFWSITRGGAGGTNALPLTFYNGDCNINYLYSKAYGMTIRCIKD